MLWLSSRTERSLARRSISRGDSSSLPPSCSSLCSKEVRKLFKFPPAPVLGRAVTLLGLSMTSGWFKRALMLDLDLDRRWLLFTRFSTGPCDASLTGGERDFCERRLTTCCLKVGDLTEFELRSWAVPLAFFVYAAPLTSAFLLL